MLRTPFGKGFVMPDDVNATSQVASVHADQDEAPLADRRGAFPRAPIQPLRGREAFDPASDRIFTASRSSQAIQLPRMRERPYFRWFVLFLVILVGSAGTIYFAFFATPQYVTEVHLTVRSSDLSQQQGDAATTAIFGLSNTTGSAYSDSFLVAEYLRSPAVVADVSRKLNLRAMFSGSQIDRISRFDPQGTQEDMVKYWQRRVNVDYDPITATAVMKVAAFTPQQSYELAQAAYDAASALINRMDDQARKDVLNFANEDLARARDELSKVEVKLATPGNLSMEEAQQLRVDRTFAQADYTNALTEVTTAKSIATRTQRYLVSFVPSEMPTSPTEPVRWKSILYLWLAVGMGTSVILLFSATIREHLL
jgi:capsule polysaccharide export protein KpsE/RkpR